MDADSRPPAQDLVENAITHRVGIGGAHPSIDDHNDPPGGRVDAMPATRCLPGGQDFAEPGPDPAVQLGIGPGGHRGHVREDPEGPQRVTALLEADDLHLGG